MQHEFDSLTIGGIPVYAADVEARQDIEDLQELYQGLTQTDVVPVTSLPVSGQANTIYRLAGVDSYADYMWDGTQFVKMAEYDNTIDSTFDPTSNNIASEKATAEYIGEQLEPYAKQNGYYETMSVGSADNLNGEEVNTASWTERPVGGAENEVASGLASVQAVGGNGCAWNQLVKNGNFVSVGNWLQTRVSYTVANNVASVSVTSGEDDGYLYQGFDVVSGHKYFINGWLKCSGENAARIYVENAASYQKDSIGSDWEQATAIISASTNRLSLCLRNFDADNAAQFKNIYIVDLTLLGVDNLTTVAEVEEWLADHIGTKPYYPYNEGTLLPAKLTGYTTTGKSANLLNPTTRTARLFAYEWTEGSENRNCMFTIKNLPASVDTITFVPDATGETVYILKPETSQGANDGINRIDASDHVSLKDYGAGTLTIGGSADLSGVWLVATWDGNMDSLDNFEAWDGKSYAFDTSKIYGKLNGAGNYVQVFPNGMRGAGSVHDVIDLQSMTANVNCGVVDLGNIDYTHTVYGDINIFYAGMSGFGGTTIGYNPKLCPKYPYKRVSVVGSISDKMIVENQAEFQGSMLIICDNSYTDATTFKTAMSGVYMWFVLGTPLQYSDCVYRDNGVDTPLSELNILVNNWSYEQAIVSSEDVSGQPTSCSPQSTILYGIDAVEAIKTLQDAGIDVDAMHGNLDALLTALQTAGIIGSYTLGETPTNKIFSITVTAPSEPESEP